MRGHLWCSFYALFLFLSQAAMDHISALVPKEVRGRHACANKTAHAHLYASLTLQAFACINMKVRLCSKMLNHKSPPTNCNALFEQVYQ